jgi:drug/metabolite transporter (DMT)-like permease
VTFRKYLVLAGVTVFGAAGDSVLSHGMKQVGNISIHDLPGLIFAVLNPYVAIGILLLLTFIVLNMTALSWADLTYVLPATSMGYVLLALSARFILHEQVSLMRWLGIVLISGGVGFIAGSPALTSHGDEKSPLLAAKGAARNGAPAGSSRNGAPAEEVVSGGVKL